MKSETNVIATDDLTKHYGSRVGVDSLDLTIEQGTIFGFLGPNGAGKTTSIRLLLGLLRPTRGQAKVLGMDARTENHHINAEVGYISGDLRLYPWMTARRALSIIGRVRGIDLATPGLGLCERFTLEDNVRVRNMSRGMRQKLGLVLALAHDPRLLVLDEPTTALDPPMQQTLYDYLRESAARGVTVFFSSHTLSEVEDLCDRIAILRAGRLIANEPLEALRARAARRVSMVWNDEDAIPSDAPEFLRVDSRDAQAWNCTLTGDVQDLLAWASRQALSDITISKPDLDVLFHEFYQEDAS